MIRNQLQQLQYDAKNLQGLSGQQWDNAEAALQQLNSAMDQTHALTYAMNNADQQFKQRYPGYNNPATTNYSRDYQVWVQTNQATMNGVLDQINVSYQQQNEEQAADEILANRAKSSSGQMQALQVGNEISAEQIAQLQKLRTTMMAESNAEAEYAAYQSQKDAAQQKSVDAVVQNASSRFPSYQENTQFGFIPSFGNGR
jgi:P-type conjugative transfer protein TrbJ